MREGLFVSQSDYGVDAHGAPRGDETRRCGHNHQQHGDASKRQWVMRADAEELVGLERCQSQRGADANRDADLTPNAPTTLFPPILVL
jgi:hypothetical protein